MPKTTATKQDSLLKLALKSSKPLSKPQLRIIQEKLRKQGIVLAHEALSIKEHAADPKAYDMDEPNAEETKRRTRHTSEQLKVADELASLMETKVATKKSEDLKKKRFDADLDDLLNQFSNSMKVKRQRAQPSKASERMVEGGRCISNKCSGGAGALDMGLFSETAKNAWGTFTNMVLAKEGAGPQKENKNKVIIPNKCKEKVPKK